jgi:hypothetical protein
MTPSSPIIVMEMVQQAAGSAVTVIDSADPCAEDVARRIRAAKQEIGMGSNVVMRTARIVV